MEQQLVGAPLTVVDDHIGRIVEEVSDREADEGESGVGVLPLQICHHAGCLSDSQSVLLSTTESHQVLPHKRLRAPRAR